MAHREVAVLETLLLPFSMERLHWPEGGVLFLRARDGWPLHQSPFPGLLCEQSFKPDADALCRAGCKMVTASDLAAGRKFPLVLVLPPRQREESRALLARAIAAAAPGGRVVACMSNKEGARSGEADLAQLAGRLETITKNKCRVYWTAAIHGPVDPGLAQEWSLLDAVRPIAGGRFLSRPGVFAWDRIDVASALLAQQLPTELSGRAADLGCGFGYLGAELLTRCPGVTALDLYEAERRALELAEENLKRYSDRAELGFHWHDVTQGLTGSYDVIVTNPPFHTGQASDRPDIGRRFIAIGAAALRRGGQLWLVANRHLPYESVLNASFGTVRVVNDAHGFKIIAAVKS